MLLTPISAFSILSLMAPDAPEPTASAPQPGAADAAPASETAAPPAVESSPPPQQDAPAQVEPPPIVVEDAPNPPPPGQGSAQKQGQQKSQQKSKQGKKKSKKKGQKKNSFSLTTNVVSWSRTIPWDVDTTMPGAVTEPSDSILFLGGPSLYAQGGGLSGGLGVASALHFNYGRQITERLILGATLGVGWEIATGAGDTKQASIAGFLFTPSLQVLFLPGAKVRPFVEGRAGIAMSADTRSGDSSRFIALGPLFGIAPGLQWGFGKQVALLASVPFAYAPFWADNLANDQGFQKKAHTLSLGINGGLSVSF